MSGNNETFKHLSNAGCDITERGHIVLSRSRLNSVVSNVIGAAAYFGKPKMMGRLLEFLSDADYINLEAVETQDGRTNIAFKPEYGGYTPLMLAVVSPYSDLQTI